jgi:PUA domain protein
MTLRVRKRHRLRKKEIKTLLEELESTLSVQPFSIDDNVELASSESYEIVFINGELLFLVYDGKVFPSVRGLIKNRTDKRFVTVDMGAVSYVYNGADIMSPGIVDADTDITEGDLVWIRDDKNKQPLAVGRALISGQEMVDLDTGKAIVSIHHIGDKLWKYGEE